MDTDRRFDNISMTGRMAYVILCVETFLTARYPDRDAAPLLEILWKATQMDWGEWPQLYAGCIPHVLFSYDGCDADLEECFSEATYDALMQLYDGITTGDEDDALDVLLTKPHEMAMVYEGTGIGDGHESVEIIRAAERILSEHGVPLPDPQRVAFSEYRQRHGWGEAFDGRSLSRVLGRPRMRLFVAITLSEDVKDALCGVMRDMAQSGVHARYSARDNLHITLAFIGETDRVREIKDALGTVTFAPFTIEAQGFGRFGDLCWVGVADGSALAQLAESVRAALAAHSISYDAKPFTPHITVARRAAPVPAEVSVPSAGMQVMRLSLMKSERIEGRVRYTEIAAWESNGNE